MDGHCTYFTSSLFNGTCELLNDVPEPSLTSLDDSVDSDTCQLIKDQSFSDGEAISNNNIIMTSTPQRIASVRRSVSLMDVSKIDGFPARPLANMLTSWETMGSQSSVGKSRDSGYVQSGSLLSVNSGKLSETKIGSEQVNNLLEDYSRLKQELEYSEILINTLQETNNDLRIKCAAAHNRISELRLKCANHCDCCSKQNTKVLAEHNISSDSFYIPESGPSSPESSRCSSPEPSPSFLDNFNEIKSPHQQVLLRDKGNETEDELCIGDTCRNLCRTVPRSGKMNLSFVENKSVVQSNRHHSDWTRSDFDVCTRHKGEGEAISMNLQETKCAMSRKEPFSDPLNNKIVASSPNLRNSIKHLNSAMDFTEEVIEDDKESSMEEKSLFVADEMNGKIWVGSFKVWGDSAIRVAPKSPLLSHSFSSVNHNSHQSLENLNYNHSKSFNNLADERIGPNQQSVVSNNVEVKIHTSSPSVRTIRPNKVYSSYSTNSDISSRLQNNNKNCKVSFQPKKDSVNITVSSKSDWYQLKISPNSCVKSSSAPLKSNAGAFNDSKHYLRSNTSDGINQVSSYSYEPESVNRVRSYSPSRNTCQTNLSNLGVSVTKSSDKGLCPKSVLEKWKSLKSKFEKISLGSLISPETSEKLKSKVLSSSNFISVIDQSPSLLNQSKLISYNSNADSPVSHLFTPITPSFGKENSPNVSPPSQCLKYLSSVKTHIPLKDQ